MTGAPESKSRPPNGHDPTPLPPITGPYIRCQTCAIRAYLVPDWRPSFGINPFLRKFLCERHHDTYRAFTQADLDELVRRAPQAPDGAR